MDLDWKFYVFTVTPSESAGPFAGGRRIVQVYAPYPETVRWALGAFDDEMVQELPASSIEHRIGPVTFLRKASDQELVDFYTGIVRCFEMGVAPARALDLLIGAARTPYFRGVLSGVKHRLNNGDKFADSLRLFPLVFTPDTVALVEAGEKAGDLKKVFTQVADASGRNQRLTKKLVSAMIYPALMMCLIVVALFVLSWKVFPGLESSLLMLGADLPPTTKFVFGMSNIVRRFPFVVLVPPATIWFIWSRWRKLMEMEAFEKIVLRLPIFGSAFRGIILVRSLRTLCMLIEAGVSTPEAYAVVIRSCNDKVYASYFKAIATRLEAGDSESAAFMKERARIPGREGFFIAQYAQLGAFTGNVTVNLLRYATQLDEDVNLLTDNLPRLLEPVMTIFITLFIGFIVMSVYKPYFDILIRLSHSGGH